MKYMIDNGVILRNDNPFKKEFTATLVDYGKTYKFDLKGYQLLMELTQPKDIAEFRKDFKRITNNKLNINSHELNEKVISFLNSGLEMKLITNNIYKYTNERTIPKSKFSFNNEPYRFPEDVIISLTGQCNLKCRHCMAQDISQEEDKLSYSRILQLLDEFDQYGLKVLKFSGRETTLHPKFWDILEYATSKRFAVTLLTNGKLLEVSNMRKLHAIKKRRKRGFNVSISLDGFDRESHEFIRGDGTFDVTVNNIINLISNGFIPCINTVIHKKNYKNIDKMIKFLMDLGVQYITLSMLMEIGEMKENNEIALDDFEISEAIIDMSDVVVNYKDKLTITLDTKHLKTDKLNTPSENLGWGKNVCPAGISSVFINHNGDVYPCVEGAGIKELVTGNILSTSLKNIWDSSAWHLYRGGWQIEELDSCKICKENNSCSLINCRIHPYIQNGNFWGTINNCKVIY